MSQTPSKPAWSERRTSHRARAQAFLALGFRSLRGSLDRLVSSPRLRGEIAWVVIHRSIEFVLLFALLKILTTLLGKEGFGEYNLAETAVLLVASVLVGPVVEAYKRDYHASNEPAVRRAAAATLIHWYVFMTLGTAGVMAVTSTKCAQWFGLAPWTALAAGLVFLGERWRLLGHEWLNLDRERRAGALWNLGFLGCQILLITAAVTLASATATTALLAYALASLIFGALVAGPTARELLRLPRGARSRVPALVLSFGIPFAALQLLQWVQAFSDRYMVKGLLDPASVGLYVAAYQVCGVPFVLGQRISHELLIPVAYQRSRDVDDLKQLWSADRLILAGVAAQFAIGIGMVCVYALFGSRLLVLLTSADYVLPGATVAILAAARFAQAISQSVQALFAIHQKMGRLLWFRIAGALLTPTLCYFTIPTWGVSGAAIGTLLSFLFYLLLLALAPGGGIWLLSDARRRARQRQGSAPSRSPR